MKIGRIESTFIGLLAVALSASCENAMVMMPVAPEDLDRQCSPDKGCRDDLVCIKLLVVKQLADMGTMEVNNYACRLKCESDANCPTMYRCVRPMPPPMTPVCVPSKVAENLGVDGGP